MSSFSFLLEKEDTSSALDKLQWSYAACKGCKSSYVAEVMHCTYCQRLICTFCSKQAIGGNIHRYTLICLSCLNSVKKNSFEKIKIN
jgi:hypothetical protein